MEKVKNCYECLFIVDCSNGEEATQATVKKFTDIINANATSVIDINEWGKRRLAYLINDKPEGYYVVATFKSAPSFPAELQRLLTIDESIMRQVLVSLKYEPTVKAAAPVEEAPVAEEEAAPAEEAPAAVEEVPAEEPAVADAE